MPTELEAGICDAVRRATEAGSLLDVPRLSKQLAAAFLDSGLTQRRIADELIRRGIEARANIEMESRSL